METTFHMLKSKFGGETLLSKTGQAQANEVLMRVLCLNISVVIKAMYQLGIFPEFSPSRILSQNTMLDSESLSGKGF